MIEPIDEADILGKLSREYRQVSETIQAPSIRTIHRRSDRRRRQNQATRVVAAAALVATLPLAWRQLPWDWRPGDQAATAQRTRVLEELPAQQPSASRPLTTAPEPKGPGTKDPAAIRPAPEDPSRSTDPEPSSDPPSEQPQDTTTTQSVEVAFRLEDRTSKGCRKVTRVVRSLPDYAGANARIWAVLNGPTQAERVAGVRSVFGKGGKPTAARISIDHTTRVVVVDFASAQALELPPGGCGGGEIVWPLQDALDQWSSDWRISFQIAGDKQAFGNYLKSVSK
ncbi:MAG: hypothetical protein ACRCYU_21340 [Nocardioides sp.]